MQQKDTLKFDEDLFKIGFVSEQLMELSGLSVAAAIERFYPPARHNRVLVVCGPGNNGGDGLIAARHLHEFGYSATVCCPREAKSEVFRRLQKQCEATDVPIISSLPANLATSDYTLIVDAIFGYSFSGEIRQPYSSVIASLVSVQSRIPVVSVDIPSGWHVDNGPVGLPLTMVLRPAMLISLTAPKLCSRFFTGTYHVLGGRFVPARLAQQYQVTLPRFPGSDQFVLLNPPSSPSASSSSSPAATSSTTASSTTNTTGSS